MIGRPETVVIDTNVIISAILFRHSTPWRALVLALTEGLVLSSSATRNELREVLSRPKFDRIAPRLLRLQEAEIVLEATYLVQIIEPVRACRDPRDDKFLELALDGRADAVITGDADLLALHPFRNTQILTPAAFVSL